MELQEVNVFEDEREAFESDVHLLILATLHAAIKYLGERTQERLTDIAAAIPRAKGAYQNHLVDEHADTGIQNIHQNRFLRNIALVALASRLLHTLNRFAMLGEFITPRRNPKSYGKSNMSEFERFWVEYEERFSLDFTKHRDKIAFTGPLKDVRNQIVHRGGEATPWKRLSEITVLPDGTEVDLWDTSFADKYPEYVHGSGGIDAEVEVTEEQLQTHVDASLQLARWLADELHVQDEAARKRLEDQNSSTFSG